MNPRTVSRGDAALAAAALLLLISSFLPYYSADCGSVGSCTANAWHGSFFPLLPAVFFLGVIGAALVLAGRLLPRAPKVAGIELVHWGTVLTVAALWSALWSLFSTPSPLLSHSFGAYLGFLFALLTAGAAIATPLLPALAAPLATASPTAPQQLTGPGGYPTYGQPFQSGQSGQPGQQPYQPQPGHQFHHGQPIQQAQPGQPFSGPVAPGPAQAQNPAQPYQPQPSGYGYPQPAPAAHAPAPAPAPAPTAATPQDAPPREREDNATALLTPVVKPQSSAAAEGTASGQQAAAAPAASASAAHNLEKGAAQAGPAPVAGTPAAPTFAPFWFAVPAPRSLTPEGDSDGPSIGELVPGTWYLAIALRGDALLTQTQEGKRGLLSDTSGIQRG